MATVTVNLSQTGSTVLIGANDTVQFNNPSATTPVTVNFSSTPPFTDTTNPFQVNANGSVSRTVIASPSAGARYPFTGTLRGGTNPTGSGELDVKTGR